MQKSECGLTLAEMLVTIVLVGILALIAGANFVTLRDGVAVRLEAHRLVTALDVARWTAVRLGVPVGLTISDSAYSISLVTSAGDSLTPWSEAGARSRGVGLSGGGSALQFAPAGIAMGVSNRTITFSRGRASRKVVVSRLGRLTQ